MTRKRAPVDESSRHWTPLGGDDERHLQFLAREVRDGWTGRVRREVGDFVEILEATYDGGVFRDEDDEPIEDVIAVDLTRPVRKVYSGPNISEAQRGTESVKIRLGPGYKARLKTLAEAAGYTLGEWVEAQIVDEERERAASEVSDGR